MKDRVSLKDKPLSWLELRTEGTWTEDDGRRFCLWCNKMLRVGERVIEHKDQPTHRGGIGKRTYQHSGGCPNPA